MRHKNIFYFGASLLSLLFLQKIYPGFKPLFFAPYLCKRFYSDSLSSILMHCLLCGTICDIFSSLSLGIYIIGYCISGIICYKFRFIFFEDKFFSLSCLTIIFSVIFNFASYLTLPILNYRILLNIKLITKDLINTCYTDALFSLFIFTLPSTILKKISKIFRFIRRCS